MTSNITTYQYHVLIEITSDHDYADQVRQAVAYLRSEPTLDQELSEFMIDFPRIGRRLNAKAVDVDLLDSIKLWLESYTPIKWRSDLPTVWTHELAA